MTRALPALLLLALAACHDASAPRPLDGIAIVLVGSDEPLPFDPRGSRITVALRQVEELLGHPLVLELDTALSPTLKASLEESVLASLENIARELTIAKRNPDLFAIARKIERVRARYDVLAKYTDAKLVGSVLEVRSPPHRFPLLENGVLTHAVIDTASDALLARWGEADPAKLGPEDQELWFDAMTTTRPGYGYIWTHAHGAGQSDWSHVRGEHLERILRLAGVVAKGSPLSRRVTDFLLTEGTWIGEAQDGPNVPVRALYEIWLGHTWPTFDDGQTKRLVHALYHQSMGTRAVFPGFDRVPVGLAIYDGWRKDGAPVPAPGGDRGDVQKEVLCPAVPSPEADDSSTLGCSRFFGETLRDESGRRQLAARIEATHDARLLELALLNVDDGSGSGTTRSTREAAGMDGVVFLEQLKDPELFHHGFRVLFDGDGRRDTIREALEARAFTWWRDAPARRGMALLVLGRRTATMHPIYADSQWERHTRELGGPLSPETMTLFFAEGARAVEEAPLMWLAFPKGAARNAQIAKAIPGFLDRDTTLRVDRVRPTLALLRRRLCAEHDAAGFAMLRASLQEWATRHPADASAVANAIVDASVTRCREEPKSTF